ncbi:hypothetical protein HGRIS_002001 [Hohenbuehelia grisea]|uniref:NAD(+) diphosphatase n=1 Tax=Hohenbuehelia grisea TaxID=104357 RepID=A0ABR3JKA7_9AGAR
MFSGSPLNRLSWLRPSHAFLNALVNSPATRWMLFNAGQPLVSARPESKNRDLAFLSTKDVSSLLGPEPFFGQGQTEGDLVALRGDGETHKEEGPLEAIRHRGPRVVFLGLLQPEGVTEALPSSEFTDPLPAVARLEGTPYFAIDVADLEGELVDRGLKESALEGVELSWSEPRAMMTALDALHGGMFAEARSLVDWNTRNQFCPACGSPTYSLWGGWKISCSAILPWWNNEGRKPCPTVKGLHNFTHPRTDPVVIMIAIDESGDKILLGRNKKFPGKFYSALAGFIEPGESFEDAVVREMWEEAGVKVWNVAYHSGQPWPFPANLMVGFYSRADSSQPIRVDLDNELQDARWYTREEILAVLNHQSGTYFSARDHKVMSSLQENRNNLQSDSNQSTGAAALAHSDPSIQAAEKPVENSIPASDMEPPFRLPPVTAIAGVLIRDWATGKIGFGASADSIVANVPRGNL